MRWISRSWIVSAIALPCFGACTPKDGVLPKQCDGLNLEVLDTAVAPPANVAALVRVTDCDGLPLRYKLDDQAFQLAEDDEVLSSFEATRQVIPAQRQTELFTLLALDSSGSIIRSGLRPKMVEGARRFAAELSSSHQVAVYGFDGRPDSIPFTYFTSDPEVFSGALDRVLEASLVDDSTNLNGAIVGALQVLDRAVEVEARDPYAVAHGSLVVFSDGTDRAGRVDASDAIDAIDGSEHSTFAIQVGAEVDGGVLASVGKDGRFVASDADGIAGAFDAVAHEVVLRAQENYVVSYCSPARAGSRKLTLEVREGELKGSADLHFSANGFGAGCSAQDAPLR